MAKEIMEEKAALNRIVKSYTDNNVLEKIDACKKSIFNHGKYTEYDDMQELLRMGAKITIEGKAAIIKGTKKLHGATVKATDLRGGAAMVLAGLAANGTASVFTPELCIK